ncbi:hypothetical protein CA831_29695, partial [Burkholderia multivorans]
RAREIVGHAVAEGRTGRQARERHTREAGSRTQGRLTRGSFKAKRRPAQARRRFFSSASRSRALV